MRPKFKGGLNEATNLIPSCRRCNGHKGAKDVEAWYRAQPFFTEERWAAIQQWRRSPWV
ncbi:MAG: hypothetical protein ACO3NK_07520 [Prochlorotrichaceae cyanobacterium]